MTPSGAFGRLVEAVRQALDAHGMPVPGDRVLVGLSGGPDSVALLHALRAAGMIVEAAHLDHGLRPESADEAACVQARCADWGVPIHMERVRVERGRSMEEAAREARYAFLEATAARRGIGAIALGHHADDQAETLLFRLARGTGPDGLAGMAPVREGKGVRIIRPLLGVRRAQIEAGLTEAGLPFLTDASNADWGLARNRIRGEVLPALERTSPGAAGHLAALAERMREEREAREESVAWLAKHITRTFSNGVGEMDRRSLLALGPTQRRWLVRHLAARVGAPAWDASSTESVIEVAATGGAVDLAGGSRAWVDGSVLVITGIAGNSSAPSPVSFRVDAADQPTAPWGWAVTSRLVPAGAEASVQASPVAVRFRASELPSGLVWRSGRPDADVFRPFGATGTHSLRHFLTRAGLPAHRQEGLLVLASGEVVYWVVGVRRGGQAIVQQTPEDVWEMQAAARFWV